MNGACRTLTMRHRFNGRIQATGSAISARPYADETGASVVIGGNPPIFEAQACVAQPRIA
jgi:hypothetical protein